MGTDQLKTTVIREHQEDYQISAAGLASLITSIKLLPTEAIIEVIYEASKELKQRDAPITERYQRLQLEQRVPGFPQVEADPEQFRAVPQYPSDDVEPYLWRLMLVSPDPRLPPLMLEVNGETIIGRKSNGSPVDVDLTPYGADTHGVSRQHALLRPSSDGLQIADLGSTNGTFFNHERIKLGDSRRLEDGVLLGFGKLLFQVKLIG